MGLRTIGLRCPASLEGVEAALLETDGAVVTRAGPFRLLPHPPALQRALRAALEAGPEEAWGGLNPALERLMERCAEAVAALVGSDGMAAGGVMAVGLDGPGLAGCGRDGVPVPLLEGGFLARRLGLPVASGFGGGLAAGEDGRVILPPAYPALTAGLPRPLAILDLDGVARVTWLGAGDRWGAEALHFEAGPAGGPAEGWAGWSLEASGEDTSGRLAMAGRADGAVLARLIAHPWLWRGPAGPPEWDGAGRDEAGHAGPGHARFDRIGFERALRRAGAMALPPADGAAVVVACSALCVAEAARHLPAPPRQWLLAGRGRVNAALRRALAAVLEEPVRTVDAAGFDGMAFPSQALAVLAARAMQGMRDGAGAAPPSWGGWQAAAG
ncbi:anhydro-N-acetylmuramic acid kinase [Roseomonas gilardii]|uniref:anhydro-N-acetylmuramic acid kinase n=1 Tax=Roseomonas gilardii TaxID=257708 RepID=UPI001C92D099|nr:anhydro-N-acetylmuramic acid kinase [Roseomonas gilardii]